MNKYTNYKIYFNERLFMKKYIPNILTTYRLIVALLMPILFFKNYYNLLTILFITALLSDAIDGVLARKWNVTSTYGKLCDMVGDKLLALSACSTFIIAVNKYFIVTLILELIICFVNMINIIKSGALKNNDFSNHKSSICGKIKTCFLFTSLFFGYISYKFKKFDVIIIPLIIITGFMQMLTAINYIFNRDIKLKINV